MTIYQEAKVRFNKLREGQRPDSLTRRGETLIATKYFGNYDKGWLTESWEKIIRDLFPTATIHKVTISRWYVVRAYFTP